MTATFLARPQQDRPSPARRWPSRILPDHRGALLRDHDGRRIGVAGGDGRHHRGVDDAQALRGRTRAAARRPPPSDRWRGPSSRCRPDGRSWCRYRPRPSTSCLVVVAPTRARQILLRLERRERRLPHDAAASTRIESAATRRSSSVDEIVRLDRRRVGRIGGLAAGRSRGSSAAGWQTLAVKAGNVCSGSPNRSSDSGCT